MHKKQWQKNGKLILLNFAYINSSLTFFNCFYFIVFFFSYVWTGGFLVYVWLILEVAYFIFWLWNNIFYQLNTFRLRNFILDSPISMIIGKLGTGKTLLLTYLNEIMQTKSSHVYTNYPINDKNTKIITFKHFDFNDKTKLIPPNNSFIGFDESFLYMDGTDPKTTKLLHNGKIPYILLARHFNNNLCITAQRPNMVWNNIRELATCTIIPLSLKKPPNSKTLIPKFFIMELGVFQDMDMYEIWKNKSMERVSDGKKSKRKSDMGLGVKFFKIIIPLSIAKKYDSCWLNFVRELKNDKIKDQREYYWNDIEHLSNQEKLKLFDIDILKKNLGGN